MFASLSGVTASLVLQSALEPLPGFSSSLLTLYVPVVLRDGASGLTNTGTVTVTICPCLRGGMQTEDRGKQKDRRWEKHMVCLPVPSPSTSLIFSLVTLLSMLACVTTLLGRCETFLRECLPQRNYNKFHQSTQFNFFGGVILNAGHFVVASQAKSRLFFFFF